MTKCVNIKFKGHHVGMMSNIRCTLHSLCYSYIPCVMNITPFHVFSLVSYGYHPGSTVSSSGDIESFLSIFKQHVSHHPTTIIWQATYFAITYCAERESAKGNKKMSSWLALVLLLCAVFTASTGQSKLSITLHFK